MSRERSSAAPSQRQLRVGEQIRHLLAEHLMRGDLHNRHLQTVSITISEVYVAELGQDAQPATLEALGRVAPVLSGRLAREMNLKYAPKLRFEADTSFSYAARIDSLLQEGLKPHQDAADEAGKPAADPDRRDEQ